MGAAIFKAENARLMTRMSSERAGLGDYVSKRNFRRELDQDIRREGYDYFWPNTSGAFASNPGDQPFPWRTPPPGESAAAEPVCFIGRAERPNGEHAIIAGSKTKLWRYIASSGGGYVATGYVATGYVEETTAVWLLIGSGFSENAHRWEYHNIDGSMFLNNGVDLPVTFRIEDGETKPVYELRDQGIASLGTIGEISGILMGCDVSEIQSDAFLELMRLPGDITTDMTVEQTGTTVSVPADFFDADHVGLVLVRDGYPNATIQSIGDARTATVDTNAAIPPSRFSLRYTASQTGATYSGLVVADITSGFTTVTASSAIFSAGMVGKTLRFSDGFSSVIQSYFSSTVVVLTDAPDHTITDLPFWVTDADIDNDATVNDKLTASADFFTSDMVGRTVIFDTGETRLITKYIDAQNVKVDADFSIASTLFRLNNILAYTAFTDTSKIDRVQYRALWSMPNNPRRFGVRVPIEIEAGSRTVTLQYPSLSFEAGQSVTIIGAGADDGNLSTEILAINGTVMQIADAAETTVGDFTDSVIHTDAIGSIVGFEDLQNDSSAILRALRLGKRTLVIYKDTTIFLATYTGIAAAPFSFEEITIPKSVALRYRWSLIDAGGMYHIYAGSNSFYRFDLATQRPQVIPQLDLISNLFFTEVDIDDQESVFAADNTVSNEVFIWFPSSGTDKALCFDYKHESASTADFSMTAACSVKRPSSSQAVGATEDLFLMGNSAGTVLIYGRADSPQASWGDEREIIYRRSAYPFSATKSGYASTLKSGIGDFGDPHNIKDLIGCVLYLASQSENTGVLVKLYGKQSPREEERLIYQEYLENPSTEHLIATFFREYYFAYEIIVDGSNNPVRLAGIGWDVTGVQTQSHERRIQ